ncbi:hypothetical protein B0H12DRAFT_1243850 [Mycena haematopus]|nr:hypothetical protein B0H12DRAFT_1243850 [Mycena haematopus]
MDPRSLLRWTDSGCSVSPAAYAVPPTSPAHPPPSPAISVDLPPFTSAHADYHHHAGRSILTPAAVGNTNTSSVAKAERDLRAHRHALPPVPAPSTLPGCEWAHSHPHSYLHLYPHTCTCAGHENAALDNAPAPASGPTLPKSAVPVPLLDPAVIVSLPPPPVDTIRVRRAAA